MVIHIPVTTTTPQIQVVTHTIQVVQVVGVALQEVVVEPVVTLLRALIILEQAQQVQQPPVLVDRLLPAQEVLMDQGLQFSQNS